MRFRNQQPIVLGAVLVAAAGAALFKTVAPSSQRAIVPSAVQVYFSPKGGCAGAIVEALGQAKSSVLVQAYSFTNAAIARALVDAHRRGVKVQMILDKSQVTTERYSEADFTSRAGIPTWIDSAHPIAHNKVMVIDGSTVITGSFNFTKAAEEHNAENLLVLHSAALAKRYTENWEEHRGHSQLYEENVKSAR